MQSQYLLDFCRVSCYGLSALLCFFEVSHNNTSLVPSGKTLLCDIPNKIGRTRDYERNHRF